MIRATGLASIILGSIVVGLSPANAQAQAAAFSRPAPVPGVELSPGYRPLFAIPAQAAAPERPRYFMSFGQVFLGTLGAVVVGLAAYNALDKDGDPGVSPHRGYSPNANTGYAIGSFIGSTAAIYLVGTQSDPQGSLAKTAIGTGIATVPFLLGRNHEYLPVYGVILGAPLQAVVGSAFHAGSRK